jgi:hypothetical protein
MVAHMSKPRFDIVVHTAIELRNERIKRLIERKKASHAKSAKSAKSTTISSPTPRTELPEYNLFEKRDESKKKKRKSDGKEDARNEKVRKQAADHALIIEHSNGVLRESDLVPGVTRVEILLDGLWYRGTYSRARRHSLGHIVDLDCGKRIGEKDNFLYSSATWRYARSIEHEESGMMEDS